MIEVQNRQSLFDIALQECGTVEAVFDIALDNGLSVTDYVPGTSLNVSPDIVTNDRVLKLYKERFIRPATSEDYDIVISDLYVDEDYWDENYVN